MKRVIVDGKEWTPEDVSQLAFDLAEFGDILKQSYDFIDAKEVDNAVALLQVLAHFMENKHA